MISCGSRLAPFDIPQLREVMSYDELELDRIGDRKTAVFFIISDTTQKMCIRDRSLAEHNGVTEQLKAKNQMEWVRQMNACKAQAEELSLIHI